MCVVLTAVMAVFGWVVICNVLWLMLCGMFASSAYSDCGTSHVGRCLFNRPMLRRMRDVKFSLVLYEAAGRRKPGAGRMAAVRALQCMS